MVYIELNDACVTLLCRDVRNREHFMHLVGEPSFSIRICTRDYNRVHCLCRGQTRTILVVLQFTVMAYVVVYFLFADCQVQRLQSAVKVTVGMPISISVFDQVHLTLQEFQWLSRIQSHTC